MNVTFVDKWGALHTYSLKAAADDLKALYDEWPGGLEEIESALATAKAGHLQPRLAATHWCAGCNPDNCPGCHGVTRSAT